MTKNPIRKLIFPLALDDVQQTNVLFSIFLNHTNIAATQRHTFTSTGMEKVILERTIPLPADLKIQGALDHVQRNLYQLL
jgi:hypothetical protein